MRVPLHKCPSCGGSELHLGRGAPQTQFDLSRDSWAAHSPSVPLDAFVCLSCGYVGHFVSSSDLEALRGLIEKDKSQPDS